MSKFYKKEFYLTGLLLLFTVMGFAQVKVTGVVKGSDGGLTLPGASVTVKGTSTGVTTDVNGNFAINAPADGVLKVSFIGYVTREVNIAGQSVINITLQSEAKGLNEVVVVGYGTQKKANLTGAVGTVSAAELENRPVTSVTNALEGIVPGVTVRANTGGQPGFDGANLDIRGPSLNSTPVLVVIDGIIGSGSDMNAINPDDIDNISILKDAASASIYGNRAAGGVILITTKKGKKGTSQITYSNYFGKNTAVALPNYVPSWEAATMYDQARVNEGQSAVYTPAQIDLFKNGSQPYTYPNTDWLKLFYNGSGFQQNHYLGVSGGTDKTQYAISLGYFDEDGITVKTNSQRYTARLNLTTQVSDKLSAFGYFSYEYNPTTQPQSSLSADQGYDQVIRQFNRISPIIPAYYANGDYGHISDGSPLAWIKSPSFYNQTFYKLQGSAGFDWQPVKGLHLKPTLNYRFSPVNQDDFVSSIQYYNADGSTSGTPNIANSTNTYYSTTYISPQLTADYSIKFGNHSIKVLAGASEEYTSYYNLSGYAQGYLNNSLSNLNAAPSTGSTVSNYTYDYALRSFFGRVNYDYKGKYLLEGDIRDDGTSRFIGSNRWGVFPGASAGWRVSEEDFFAGIKSAVSNLKLRASWGKLGNQNITGSGSADTYYYPALSTVSSTGQGYPFGGSLGAGVAPTIGVNPDLTWETTTQTDIGFDADFLKKFSFTADYFIKKVTGVLFQTANTDMYPLSAPYENGSSYQNKGWELALTYRDKAGDFGWSVTGNAAFITNKITQLGATNAPVISGATINQVGQPMNSFYGFVAQGLFQNAAQVSAHADQTGIGPNTGPGDIIYKDVKGDGKIDANDKVVLGSNFPKVTFGLNLTANWKQFDLSGFFQGAAGVKNYISGIELGTNSISTGKPTTAMENSWTPTNPNAAFPRLWISYTQNDPADNLSSFWLKNAAYVRLKNVQLGFTLPAEWAKTIGLKKLRIYYSGQNILTITSFYKWVDPEVEQGESGYDYPMVKINSIGLNATF